MNDLTDFDHLSRSGMCTCGVPDLSSLCPIHGERESWGKSPAYRAEELYEAWLESTGPKPESAKPYLLTGDPS